MGAFYGICAANRDCTTVADISPCVFNNLLLIEYCQELGDSNS